MGMIEKLAFDREYKFMGQENLYMSGNGLVYIENLQDVRLDSALLQKYIKKFVHDEIEHAIFIYRHITVLQKKIETFQNLLRLEFFSEKELMILTRKNVFTPSHQSLSKQKTREILEKYDKTLLPKILSTDPIVRYYGFLVDQIIEIERADGTIFYRIVVEDK
jgi:DNA-directed RNA polymerase subunit H (RpoH/RPB5)